MPYENTYTFVRVSTETYRHLKRLTDSYSYTGKGRGHGMSAAVLALLEANPSPSDWSDNRPDEFRSKDGYRLANNLLPLWYEAEGRGVVADVQSEYSGKVSHGMTVPGYHKLPIPDWLLPKMLTLMQPIADRFGIRHRRYSNSPTATLAVFIDAVGQTYLIAMHPPADCPNPRKHSRAGRRGGANFVF